MDLARFIFGCLVIWIVPGFIVCSRFRFSRRFSLDHFVIGFILSCVISPVFLFAIGNLWGWSGFKLVLGQLIGSACLFLIPSKKTGKRFLFDVGGCIKSNKKLNIVILIILVTGFVLPYIELVSSTDVSQCLIGDWDGREGVVWSIKNFGLPLQDPFFYPGKSLRMYYPLYFYLMPGAVSTIAPGVGIVSSWVFGITMVGISLCWVLTEYVRDFFKNRWLFAVVVLVTIFVGGFDWIVASASIAVKYFRGEGFGLIRHVDAWASASEIRIDNLYSAIIWVAPHVCGVLLFLFLVRLMPASTMRIGQAILCGIVLASIFGMSPYVFIGVIAVFGFYFLRILYRTIFRGKQKSLVGGFLVMVLICIIILLPYVIDLQKADLSDGKAKLKFHIPVSGISVFGNIFGDSVVTRLLDIPIYYFVELGPVLILCVLGIRQAKRDRVLNHRSWYLIWGMIFSFVIAGMFRSTGTYNDLGMRVVLTGQVCAALFASVWLLSGWANWKKGFKVIVAIVLLSGVVSVFWEFGAVGLSRFVLRYPPDRFELYKACKYINNQTPKVSIIAVDPEIRRAERARRWMGRKIMIGSNLPGSFAYTDAGLLEQTRALNNRIFNNIEDNGLMELNEKGVSYILKKNRTDDQDMRQLNIVYRNNNYTVISVR